MPNWMLLLICCAASVLVGFFYAKAHPTFKIKYWDGEEREGTFSSFFTCDRIPGLEHELNPDAPLQLPYQHNYSDRDMAQAGSYAAEYFAAQCAYYTARAEYTKSDANSLSNCGLIVFIVGLFIQFQTNKFGNGFGTVLFLIALALLIVSIILFKKFGACQQLTLTSSNTRNAEKNSVEYYTALKYNATLSVYDAAEKLRNARKTAVLFTALIWVFTALLFPSAFTFILSHIFTSMA